ncbi:MTA/SAH nucleosidase [Sporosarcina sp. NCCP-2716]|uniref:HAD family hydrolase n=1 Tax=Sporosarcina sp. NCCP-2716 TaxID=2943679 RepID=UPI00203DAB35|nr:HAD family hydrolase [Sporosarcina sp. NCCP-2716]GKV68645.1 MTA/SAH nucleosidase [Sporosarcina sp. NCCP-2716]
MTIPIIFDIDGTLFQTDTILENALEDTFQHLRSLQKWQGETPLAQYRDIMGVPLPQVWQTLLPDHSLEERSYTDAYFLERLIDNIRCGEGALYPNALEALRFLKEQGCSIFIASNGLVEYLSAIVHYYALDTWVTETFSIQQIDSSSKSDLVRAIIEKYSLADAAVVGDRLSDINAAKDNGLTAIGCRFDFAQEDELVHADIVIRDLLELKGIIPQLSQTVSLETKG